MSTPEEVFEELNYPSAQKLKRVLEDRHIAYNKKEINNLVQREAVRQVQAPKYRFDGKIKAFDIDDRWFCDLIDFTAAPSDRGEVYILVVQDVFSRFLWTEALTSKRREVVAKAFKDILTRSGATPRSVTCDLGSEFTGPFKDFIEQQGIEFSQKRKEDINAIATIDTAIAQLKKALARDTRKIGTNDWASRLQKVTQGQNNNPIEEYLEGMPPSNVRNNPDLIDLLKQKNLQYSEHNRKKIEKRAQAIEDAGRFRIMENKGGNFTRGFKPRFGEIREVQQISGAIVEDTKNKTHLTKFVLPVKDTTSDTGPRRIEQKGSALTDATRKSRLQPFADELIRFIQNKEGASVSASAASKHLRETMPEFAAAMRNVPSFGAFIRLFDSSLKLVTSSESGGVNRVRLAKPSSKKR